MAKTEVLLTHADDDHFHDECGVFGVYGHPEASTLAYLGLHGLQHRGQESAGIVTAEGARSTMHKQMGLVSDVFNQQVLERLKGCHAIGHVRYSTSGSKSLRNAQPFVVQHRGGFIAVSHNGNLINMDALRDRLETKGHIFHSDSDSEVFVHLYALSQATDPIDRIRDVMRQVRGAYSVLLMDEHALYALRDPYGVRPLVMGRTGDHATIFSSETSALDLIDAELIREVRPGEIVRVDGNGVSSFEGPRKTPIRHCIFEHIYFGRPDSVIFGRSVYKMRLHMGRRLAIEHPVDADLVMAVPDSGNVAALGYARESGLPLEVGLIRSHYVGRTFIEPEQSIRNFGVKLKLNPVAAILRGRRAVIVDDSVVRGTTVRKLVQMLRNAGAAEVHFRISSPPTAHPCSYGLDTPTYDELIAANYSVDEIARYLKVDSLGYLSVEGLHACVDAEPSSDPDDGDGDPYPFCDACFTGDYPVTAEE
jgi:amidophosphoribosyltransferase